MRVHDPKLTGWAWSCTWACTWEQWGLWDCLWNHNPQRPRRSMNRLSWNHAHQLHVTHLKYHIKQKCNNATVRSLLINDDQHQDFSFLLFSKKLKQLIKCETTSHMSLCAFLQSTLVPKSWVKKKKKLGGGGDVEAGSMDLMPSTLPPTLPNYDNLPC